MREAGSGPTMCCAGDTFPLGDRNQIGMVIILNNIIIAEMTVFNVAGYLIEERRRWPVITASPRGQYSTHSDEKTVPVAWLD